MFLFVLGTPCDVSIEEFTTKNDFLIMSENNFDLQISKPRLVPYD